MYGVAPELSLGALHGSEITQIAIDEHQIILHFHPSGYIAVEGHWELHDEAGQILDSAQDHSVREFYRLHVILSRPITSHVIHPPDSFALLFDTGHRLTIYDSSDYYESCTIQLPDRPLIVI